MSNLVNLKKLKNSEFYKSIKDVDIVNPFIINLIGDIEVRNDVIIHYTNTNGGDLRIKKN
jgi:hypothetical protein